MTGNSFHASGLRLLTAADAFDAVHADDIMAGASITLLEVRTDANRLGKQQKRHVAGPFFCKLCALAALQTLRAGFPDAYLALSRHERLSLSEADRLRHEMDIASRSNRHRQHARDGMESVS